MNRDLPPHWHFPNHMAGKVCLLLGKTVCCVMGSNLSHLQRLMTACLFFQRALLHSWQQCWEMTEDDV